MIEKKVSWRVLDFGERTAAFEYQETVDVLSLKLR